MSPVEFKKFPSRFQGPTPIRVKTLDLGTFPYMDIGYVILFSDKIKSFSTLRHVPLKAIESFNCTVGNSLDMYDHGECVSSILNRLLIYGMPSSMINVLGVTSVF